MLVKHYPPAKPVPRPGRSSTSIARPLLRRRRRAAGRQRRPIDGSATCPRRALADTHSISSHLQHSHRQRRSVGPRVLLHSVYLPANDTPTKASFANLQHLPKPTWPSEPRSPPHRRTTPTHARSRASAHHRLQAFTFPRRSSSYLRPTAHRVWRPGRLLLPER